MYNILVNYKINIQFRLYDDCKQVTFQAQVGTADCKSFANMQAEQWKTTIDLPHMNLIIFPASAQHVCSNTIVVFLGSLACCKTFAICCNR